MVKIASLASGGEGRCFNERASDLIHYQISMTSFVEIICRRRKRFQMILMLIQFYVKIDDFSLMLSFIGSYCIHSP